MLRGVSHGDDTGVFRAPSGELWSHTVDVLTPLVDDPTDFGTIVAANALSDLYAAGAEPRAGLAILAAPSALPEEAFRAILAAMARVLSEAGAALVGGHSLRGRELMAGLSVAGVHPEGALRAKTAGRAGDRLYLTKPLGTGILTSAYRSKLVGEEDLREATASMRRTNAAAAAAASDLGIAAATDVTGFGLLGHLLQMTRGTDLAARIDSTAVPALPGAGDLAARGAYPGGTKRNREWVSSDTAFAEEVPEAARVLLCDAQTSGGLLLSCPVDRAGDLEQRLAAAGLVSGAIGAFERWPGSGPRVSVRP